MFKGILIEKDDAGYRAAVKDIDEAQLPEGDVTVRVERSSLNYKDGLAITGKGPVVRKFPMVPGIDIAGTVEASDNPDYKVGDRVVLNGWGVGETHWGGLAQKARLKGDWLVPLPDAFTAQQAVAIGTAGYTAMLCVLALEKHGVKPADGEIVVTGAAGGVGSVAIAVLSQAGLHGGRGERPARGSGLPETAGGEPTCSSAAPSRHPASRSARSAGRGSRCGRQPHAGQPLRHDQVPRRGHRLRPGRRHGLPVERGALHPARCDAGRHRQRDVPASGPAGGLAAPGPAISIPPSSA